MPVLAFGLLVVFAACATGLREATAVSDGATIHVVSHGWHTGIVIRLADVAPGAWPEARDFAAAEYLEVGWGDRNYYQARNPGLLDALTAALVPKPGVLHIVGFRGEVQRMFPASDIVALQISPQGLARLVAHLRASYERDPAGRAIMLGPGLYGDSRFYGSVERFHLFRTCNVWTAEVLRAGGLPIGASLTADGVMAEARRAAAAPP
ncbi:MAG: DUF2459 domain-containing protein [Nitrospira sp.]|nr:DUF2459 domain-containing protein [Nitrospira sp.]